VGKNESGKTAILKALHKLKSETDGAEKFVPASDYPKRKWRPDVAVPNDPPVVDTKWLLEDADMSALEKRFGKGVILSRTFQLSKSYDNNRRYSVDFTEYALVKNLVVSAELNAEEKKPISDAKTIDVLRKGLEGIASRTENQEKLYQRVLKEFKNGATKAVIDAVDAMVPTFLYFDQYLRLPGIVSVDALLKRKNENQLTNEDRIFLALLALAGTNIETIHSAKTFEEFNSTLRAISNQISDQIFKYWTQNRHLDVVMRLDHARPSDPPPFNSGYIFRTRIENKRHRADTGFDERSTGFVWFFSFLVWFHRLRDTYKKNLIILLDEPGLTLHARAQSDLLRYINEQLRPEYQVIYTTHSPFMIDPDNLLSARTVEDVVQKDKTTDQEKLLGTKVSQQVLSTDPDTISPLQRALDYELTQTLFIGRHNVLVEGPSDLLYLKWFSQQLQKAGKRGLDYRWSISIVGGVDRIPGFVSLFRGNHLHVAALVDVRTGQKQRIENARKALSTGHLLTADKYAEVEEADIEDILGREFYIALINRAFQLHSTLELPSAKPSDAPDRVVAEVEARFATMPKYVREFDHFIPAEFLFQSGDDGTKLPGFSVAIDRMERVISDLNDLI
jgi:predicted ATPase